MIQTAKTKEAYDLSITWLGRDLSEKCMLVRTQSTTRPKEAEETMRDNSLAAKTITGPERPLPIKGSAITYMLGDIMNIHVQNDNKHQAI